MRRDCIKTRWCQLWELMEKRWDRLSEEDFKMINGDWNMLVSRLQDLYNAGSNQVENEIDRFLETINE